MRPRGQVGGNVREDNSWTLPPLTKGASKSFADLGQTVSVHQMRGNPAIIGARNALKAADHNDRSAIFAVGVLGAHAVTQALTVCNTQHSQRPLDLEALGVF